MSRVKSDFLRKVIFADNPANWLVQAQGFHHAGLELIKTSKLSAQPRIYSGKDLFCIQHAYKVGVYLLAHSIELLLKSIISTYNNKICRERPFKLTQKYSHHVIDMVSDLQKVNVIVLREGELEIFQLVEEYLKWFGRYYCPNKQDIDTIVAESFTSPDQEGMVSFKYEPKFPETHEKIDALYKRYELKHSNLDLLYMIML